MIKSPHSFHNSFPEACRRVSKIAVDALPADASAQDKEDAHIKVFKGDLTKPADIEEVFDFYKSSGGIFAVIQIAAHKAVGESGEKPIQYYQNNIAGIINLLDVRADWLLSLALILDRQ